MITRQEFAEYWEQHMPGMAISEPGSPLWEAENDLENPCQWFVQVPMIQDFNGNDRIEEFWRWADLSLQGQARCFSSDVEENSEWWGFNNRDDTVLFLLRWA